jgi:hypothetical protein
VTPVPEMRLLTVRQPWAHAIAVGEKDVENRTWRTHYRGPVAIHAAAAIDDQAYTFPPVHRLLAEADINPRDVERVMTRGAIVAVADLTDIVTDSDSRWAQHGAYHWLLANVRRLNNPIPYRGALGLNRVADATTILIESEIPT